MAERLKLAIIGDPHLAVPRGEPDHRLEVDPGRKLHGLSVELLTATIDEINAAGGVDATLVLGDLTRDSEVFNHEVAREQLARLAMPFYLVAGNHDNVRRRAKGVSYPDEPRLDRQGFQEFYRGAGLPGDTTRYAVELPGGVVLVVLDSNCTLAELKLIKGGLKRQDHGWVSQSQRRWLHHVLGNIRQVGRLPLVAVHHSVTVQSPAEHPGHPLYGFFDFWRIHDAEPLRKVLARHRVPLVLSGHLHAQSAGRQGGVLNLVTAASVSYPHAWRLLTVTDDAIHVESHPLRSIPSCADLQEQSRSWLSEGMGEMIEQASRRIPMLSRLSSGLREFIIATEWWPRFCDGTLAGFRVPAALVPEGNKVTTALYGRVVKLLNQYGTWKNRYPDPNALTIPLSAD